MGQACIKPLSLSISAPHIQLSGYLRPSQSLHCPPQRVLKHFVNFTSSHVKKSEIRETESARGRGDLAWMAFGCGRRPAHDAAGDGQMDALCLQIKHRKSKR